MRAGFGERREDRGAAAVEFALVLPILMLLLFGIVDFGRLLNAQIVISEASREGARASALLSTAAATSRAKASASSLDASMLTVDVNPECADNPGPTDDTTVTVTYNFSFVTPVMLALGFGDADGHMPITSTSVMPCLR